ncbi:SDR family oxidoreductase [Sulfitobacter sp. KE34]|uniref:SDR family NAD(P)-dependent oxidoreductase n=1 Tax=Sulfitobacter faviae TaxID=1775881 RepID=A0AAX3LUT7_9RHOB|nr:MULTISPECIES: SDR family oxidoreductase [Sulfitobacter]MDF3351270.1 SDR family oxidoreductase [Sulfitobacter sp. KE12]MDF3354942.1 SDR family oxidoreductase [Sulfitobacter sp. KE27]MDF3358590.1 SDR family oxidoreductase [Sulfitobacter sp. KE33]MDF3362405.1 SDR family oxidoreductase [Sulfitobacter sp. Ks41]MDF3366014.1 SDR family oxidoreductase [Sulfitobacter sp. Ks34]
MDQKIALITGAGSGVGLACAQRLAKDGFTLVLTGRQQDKIDAACATLDGQGHIAVAADVGIEAEVDALFERVETTFGRLDLLFNNAGRNGSAVEVDGLSVAEWNDIVATNLTGSFLCARAAFALMKRQSPKGGRIINNGSISAHVPRPLSVPYTATKHAITGLTRALSLDGRAHDIACGQIDIGNAASEMTERMKEGILQPNGSRMSEPRMDVNDVAETLSYMAKLSLDSNAMFVTVMATKMPFAGRG